jgi:hypothetical protein
MRVVLFTALFLCTILQESYPQEIKTEASPSNLLIKEDLFAKKQWLYFGWKEDHPKAISLMGGAVYPRRPKLPKHDDHSWECSKEPWHKNSSDVVLFLLSVDGSAPYYPDEMNPNRRKEIAWSLAENYLPVPVSQWEKEEVAIQITHVGKRILNNSVNAVYTQVKLTNNGKISHQTKLVINGNYVSERVFPTLAMNLKKTNAHTMDVATELQPGSSAIYEFVLPANGHATIRDILNEGDFSSQYAKESAEINRIMDDLTHPESLPYDELINVWRASMPHMWNATVKTPTDYEQRGSGGNVHGFYQYDRVFDHDVPDMVIQYIIEGKWDMAKAIMEGATFERLSKGILEKEKYNDAIPKYLIAMAQYLQVTGDKAYFSKSLFEKIKRCAHAVHDMRKDQMKPDLEDPRTYGLILKGFTLDNGSEHLVVDNFAALHGFTSYVYICDRLDKKAESQWAKAEMEDLNNCLNKALDISMEASGGDWYNACFSFDYDSALVATPGNWLGTTLMMPSFPWNAYLKGFELGGTWKDYFDSSVEKWIEQGRKIGCEDGAFGAWASAQYGAVYNAGMGMPLLYSEKYRTLTAQSIEWMLDNQTSPYLWGESFHKPHPQFNWTRPQTDLETWGLGFIRQALLQLCVSVHVDGTIILGRGIPDYWLNSGKAIAWKNVYINNGKKMNFSIHKDADNVYIHLTGDNAEGNIVVDLPAMKGHKVIKPGDTKNIVISLTQ